MLKKSLLKESQSQCSGSRNESGKHTRFRRLQGHCKRELRDACVSIKSRRTFNEARETEFLLLIIHFVKDSHRTGPTFIAAAALSLAPEKKDGGRSKAPALTCRWQVKSGARRRYTGSWESKLEPCSAMLTSGGKEDLSVYSRQKKKLRKMRKSWWNE